MKELSVPSFSSPSIITRQYRAFRGIDLSTDESQIDGRRSPRAINIISDAGGYPQLRLGWRTVRRYVGRINGVFTYKEGETLQLIVHAGAALYRDAESPVKLRDGLYDGDSTGFYMGNKLYLLTGREYLVYDGATIKDVSEDAYVPTTSYGRSPTGGGQSYEEVNLLSPWRVNRFLTDGEATDYQLDAKELDSTAPTVTLDGETVEASEYTFDAAGGLIKFKSAPPKSETGLSNLEVKFAKTVAGNAAKVTGCRLCATYGISAENRVFLAGNPGAPSGEIYSGLSDPSYFPERNYVTVGSADWPILNYLKFQGDLLVIKEHNMQEYTIWHHSAQLSDGLAVFPLSPGVAGVGAVARRSAQNLLDDAIFLSPRGVFARVNLVTLSKLEQGVRCRSNRINPELTIRQDLKDAVSVVWNGLYILAVGGVAYVADSNQAMSDNGYEWYKWTNIPARCFAQEGSVLYFGTEDGRLCRFNDDVVDPAGKPLMTAYNDDGNPIEWEWCTKMDDFGNLGMFKTLTKRGCVIQFKTAVRSTVDIYIRTEKDFGVKKRSESLARLDFNQLDFAQWTFNTLPNNIRSLRTKVKKFKQLQIILRGEAENEFFGVLEIVLRATAGNPVK